MVYSYVVEVADSEYDLGWHGKAIGFEILAIEHFAQLLI